MATVDAIVGRIYGALSQALRPMAADSVLAHLVKLREEGGVREESGSWGPVRTLHLPDEHEPNTRASVPSVPVRHDHSD